MERACNNCPLEIALNSAEVVIAGVEHTSPDTAKGGIALTRLCLSKVLENADCNGPITNNDGQTVCKLRDLTMFTRSLATSPWPRNSFDVDLNLLGGDKTDNNDDVKKINGMYL